MNTLKRFLPSVLLMLAVLTLTGFTEEKHGAAAASSGHGETVGLSPDKAFAKLKEGNLRFTKGKAIHPDQSSATRIALAGGQKPFAVIVTCSDSRLSPEIIFDQGLGDLFVIRVAGNTVDDVALGSIEYAVEHLGSQLVVVMGHDKCGAVKAAVEGVQTGKHPGEHIISVTAPILPVVTSARLLKGDLLENSIKMNAEKQAANLKKSEPILSEKFAAKKIKIFSCVYHFNTGVAEF